MRGDKLHIQYPKEYAAWRNMKARAKEHGYHLAGEFKEFPTFLQAMGPIPFPGYTLDRINPRNAAYAPSNCRWASKADQANNRRNTLKILYEGMERPISEVARLTGLNPETLRKRKKRGYSDHEVVYGREERQQVDEADLGDPYSGSRWLGTDAQIEWWRGYYLGGVEQDFGIEPLAFRDEGFSAFVLRYCELFLLAVERQNFDGLHPHFVGIIKKMKPDERNALQTRWNAVRRAAFEQELQRRFANDCFVNGDRCTPIWLSDRTSDTDFLQHVREAVRQFEKLKLPLPRELRRICEKHAGSLMLGRRQILDER